MGARTKVRITREDAQFLFRSALYFTMPEKLGDTLTYTAMEQSVACLEVGELFQELKGHSTYYQEEKLIVFGAKEWWKKLKVNGAPASDLTYELVNPEATIKLSLSENMISGIGWILLHALHPASKLVVPVGVAQEATWPLARKVRLTEMLKRDIGLKDAKHRRLEFDPLPEEAESDVKTEKVES